MNNSNHIRTGSAYITLCPNDVKCLIFLFDSLLCNRFNRPFDFSGERDANVIVKWLVDNKLSGRRNAVNELRKCCHRLLIGKPGEFYRNKRTFRRFILDDICCLAGYGSWPLLIQRVENKVKSEISFPESMEETTVPEQGEQIKITILLAKTIEHVVKGHIVSAKKLNDQAAALLNQYK